MCVAKTAGSEEPHEEEVDWAFQLLLGTDGSSILERLVTVNEGLRVLKHGATITKRASWTAS